MGAPHGHPGRADLCKSSGLRRLGLYLAGRLFDLSGSYAAIYLLDIALLLVAGLVSYAIQEQRYSLKYMASAPV